MTRVGVSAPRAPGAAAPSVAPRTSARRGRSRSVARRPRESTLADVFTVVGSAISALCLTWLVFARFTEGTGWFSFVVVTYLVFLAFSVLVNLDRLGWLVAKDRMVTTIVTTGSLVLLAPLTWLIGYVVIRGIGALRLTFFAHDQAGITPVLPATAGGGAHALVGTLEQVALALVFSVPLGLMAAVFLNETTSRWRRPVRIFVDAMSGLPSIVAGLFIYAVLILPNAAQNLPVLGINGLMASLALSMIMLPTVTRTVEVVLRLVPGGLREASLALGASRARTVWSVVLPTARTGVTTAVVLGVARVVGETAPLLFTSFGQDLLNSNPLEGPQESLPLFVWRNVRKPNAAAVDRGFAGALVLLGVILTLFAVARYLGRDRSKQTGRLARVRRRQQPSKEREP